MSAPLVSIPTPEIERLREAMRDIQSSVASFYAETARGLDELGGRARAFLGTAQVINDLMANKSAQKDAYVELLKTRTAPGVAAIEAMKYARNVDQHAFHIVRPSDEAAMVGWLHGFRNYVVWDEIPQVAHDDLHKGSKALKTSYDANSLGKDVTRTMLDVLRFYAALDPALVPQHAGRVDRIPSVRSARRVEPAAPGRTDRGCGSNGLARQPASQRGRSNHLRSSHP